MRQEAASGSQGDRRARPRNRSEQRNGGRDARLGTNPTPKGREQKGAVAGYEAPPADADEPGTNGNTHHAHEHARASELHGVRGRRNDLDELRVMHWFIVNSCASFLRPQDTGRG